MPCCRQFNILVLSKLPLIWSPLTTWYITCTHFHSRTSLISPQYLIRPSRTPFDGSNSILSIAPPSALLIIWRPTHPASRRHCLKGTRRRQIHLCSSAISKYRISHFQIAHSLIVQMPCFTWTIPTLPTTIPQGPRQTLLSVMFFGTLHVVQQIVHWITFGTIIGNRSQSIFIRSCFWNTRSKSSLDVLFSTAVFCTPSFKKKTTWHFPFLDIFNKFATIPILFCLNEWSLLDSSRQQHYFPTISVDPCTSLPIQSTFTEVQRPRTIITVPIRLCSTHYHFIIITRARYIFPYRTFHYNTGFRQIRNFPNDRSL